MYLSSFARIGKDTARSIVGTMLDYSNKYDTHIVHSSSCTGCPIFNKIKEIEQIMLNIDSSDPNADTIYESWRTQLDSIKNTCVQSECPNVKVITIYNNDNKKYNLYHKKYAFKRLPKISTKLFMLLHFLPMIRLGKNDDSYYLITDVSDESLAEALQCNIKSIQTSLQILHAFNYIDLSHASDLKHHNIHIKNYENLPRTAKEGGSGYITLNQKILDQLLEQKNVNTLRSMIYKLITSDDITKKDPNQLVERPTKDIKYILPSHINYYNKIKQVFAGDNIFDTYVSNEICSYALKSIYHLQNDSKVYINNNIQVLKKYINNAQITFLELKDIQDIGAMTTQYQLNHLIDAINYVKQNYIDKYIPVENIGGLIRTICHKKYILKLSLA